MKSIYEEAIEIIINSILPRESDKQNKLKVIKALQKAQKQEKLLELYKELNRTTFGKELLEIQEQIRELENELQRDSIRNKY